MEGLPWGDPWPGDSGLSPPWDCMGLGRRFQAHAELLRWLAVLGSFYASRIDFRGATVPGVIVIRS